MTFFPDIETFRKNFHDGKTQVVSCALPADLETPLSVYLKACHKEPYSLLLESVEGGAVLGRYSAIGLKPDLLWKCESGEASLSEDGQAWTTDEQNAPLESLRQTLRDCRIERAADALPPMASSGLFGYMGYGMIKLVENIPDNNPDVLNIPDGIMMRPTLMVIFDNVKQILAMATPVRDHAGNTDKNPDDLYTQATERLNTLQTKLDGNITNADIDYHTELETPLNVSSNITQEAYHKIVEAAKEQIYAGEIFQVVPSQRFTAPFDLPPLALYRSLRRLNPSPFLFYLQMDDMALVGSSPEILVRVRNNTVTIRPIAGTRKRGETSAEDKALAEDLLSDPKECAEHLMLLDLGRNDIGRVSEIGSVNVTDQFMIENYSHVMHIVSNVEGTLREDYDSLDALFAGFPAGTVSGAPKIRAMEIIDELESERRSFYGGCVGYLDGNGDVDTCIALRTALIKDGKVYVQAGGGVVADSDPEAEYQETCNKARALIRAAEIAVENAQVPQAKPQQKAS